MQPVTPRNFACRCGRPVFFGNSQCLACGTPLGYDAGSLRLLPLEPADGGAPDPAVAPAAATGDTGSVDSSAWRAVGAPATAPRWRRCANLHSASACNWLLPEDEVRASGQTLCRSCRLTRTLPDLSLDNGALWWMRIEMAKRRLVSSLIGLRLPVASKIDEDPEHGLVFDLLRAAPGGSGVVTGHADGVITLDVEEADDAHREQRRTALGEPYRTLLGHLRHECGHYYWQRLVEPGPWLEPCRALFGDDRVDYAQALKTHYANGAPADWNQRFVSAYASCHAWEDWAETWAHYLHLVDTLDTARSFGLDAEYVELSYERFTPDVLVEPGQPVPAGDDAHAAAFLRLVNGWMELTGVLNELSRSMGVHDFYPFVLSPPVVRKLYFVHRVITEPAP